MVDLDEGARFLLYGFTYMKNQTIVISLLLSGVITFGYCGGISIRAADHFYQLKDGIDTTRSQSEHFADIGVALTDIGGSGLSLNSDLLYSNALSEIAPDGITRASGRQPLQLTSGYLAWQSAEGKTEIKLGRQQFTSLAVEAFDFDGANVSLTAGKATGLNFGGGLTVPPPQYIYQNTNKPLLSNPATSSIFMADFYNKSLPFTSINGAFASEKSLQGLLSVLTTRCALATEIAPNDFIRFDGSGRFSTAVNGLDHIDARLTLVPSPGLEVSTWFLSEKDRIDSLNYFSIMMHEQLNEIGARLDYYPEGGGCVQGEYHVSTTKNEGTDHFFIVNAANKFLDGGVTFGNGYHGMTLRPHGGFKFLLGDYLQLKGSAEYCLIDETDNDSTYHLVTLSGGVKTIFPFGLTIYPRVEYITNRYYSQDVRFLMTSSVLLHKFWRSR